MAYAVICEEGITLPPFKLGFQVLSTLCRYTEWLYLRP